MNYGSENATFVAMMYGSRATPQCGQIHCPHCGGYAIRPIPRSRGDKAQQHEDCDYCDRKGVVTGGNPKAN